MTRTAQTAADMPAGTEVDWSITRWIKNRPGDEHPWTDNLGKTYTDDHIDRVLRQGALIGHIPTGPNNWPTRHMLVGTIVTSATVHARKINDGGRTLMSWADRDGRGRSDGWVQQRIDEGATVTYPEGR